MPVIAGRQAFAALNLGEPPSRRVDAGQLPGYQLIPSWGPGLQGSNTEGSGFEHRVTFVLVEVTLSFAGQALVTCSLWG